MLSLNDLVTALANLLPRRKLTAEDLVAIIESGIECDRMLKTHQSEGLR